MAHPSAFMLPGIMLLGTVVACAQTVEKNPIFEAASIRPSDPTDSASSWNAHPGRLTVHNMSLKKLVKAAYGVEEYQVTGGPKWLDDTRFDIVASMDENEQKLAPGKDGPARFRAAMQALLADRFQLLIHIDTTPTSGYALVSAKNGFKLKPVNGSQGSSVKTGRGRMTVKGATLEHFATFLATQFDRPVVDATGIEGAFDFTIEWTPDETSQTGLSIFTAIQETLGLKLESRRVPATMITVDRAEKPGEN